MNNIKFLDELNRRSRQACHWIMLSAFLLFIALFITCRYRESQVKLDQSSALSLLRAGVDIGDAMPLKDIPQYSVPAFSFSKLARRWFIFVPWWTLLVFTGVFSCYWGVRDWRDRAEARKFRGLCPQCGYDLRATPTRCPECGTDFKPTPVSIPVGPDGLRRRSRRAWF